MIRQAEIADLEAIYQLIENDPKRLLHRSRQEIKENLTNFIVAQEDGEVIGCASFENYSPKIAEIRSLIVKPKYRNKGVGKALVDKCLEKARNGQEIFVVTSNLSFFKKLKFYTCLKEKYILFRKK